MSRPCKLCNLKSIVIVRLWSLKLGDSGMFWQHKNILLSKSILFEKERSQVGSNGLHSDLKFVKSNFRRGSQFEST